ncbi:MAG: hypothetical protein ACT4OI_00785 [Methanobacteriota archaeon]
MLRCRRSHEAVRRWYRRCQELVPPPERQNRCPLAMGETHVRIGTVAWHPWAAIDLDSKEVFAFRNRQL